MQRLIDANALKREMYRKSFEVDDGRNVWHSGLWIRYAIFEEAIRDAPTVDAVPLRHAELIDPRPYGECSICGALIDIRDGFNYCPNCGAKIDRRLAKHV